MLGVQGYSNIEQIRCTDNTGSALTCVAVNKNSLTALFGVSFHLLADHQNLFGRGCFEILPVVVKVSNSLVVENFWVIRETNSVIDTVAARRVLTRFLKVEDGTDVVSKVVIWT